MNKCFYLILSLFLIFSNSVFSAYFKNVPVKVNQADGTTINCFATGDEYYNFLHTEDGYVIKQNDAGFYCYAEKSSNEIIASQYQVGKYNPNDLNLQKWISPEKSVIVAKMKKTQDMYEKSNKTQIAKSGNVNNLVIFIRFADQDDYPQKISTIDKLYNNEENSSFKNYYLTVSNNKFNVQTYFCPTSTTTIASFVAKYDREYYLPYNATTNPNGYKDYEESTRERVLLDYIITQASNAFTDDINFDSDNDGSIDNVTFVVQGGTGEWSSLLWPHRSWYVGSSKFKNKNVYDYNFIMSDFVFSSYYGLGTLCHEFFHSMGAPDLYHYSYDGFSPTGTWDLMDQTSTPPQFMNNLFKFQYTDWLDSIPEIKTEGEYSLHINTNPTNNCYKLASPNSTSEYFMLEYRKKEGKYDISIPSSGLLVYRINKAKANTGNGYGPPDEVYLFRPNGAPSVDGNVWEANFSKEEGRTVISDITNPRAFLSSGNNTGIEVYDVSECGEIISFKIGFTTRTYLVSPSQDEIDVDLKPTFSWRAYTAATVYQLQVAADSNFTNIIIDQSFHGDTSYTPTSELKPKTCYYARVKWASSTKNSNWSDIVKFTTIIDKPTLVYPANNEKEISIYPTFTWKDLDGKKYFKIVVAKDFDFQNTVFAKNFVYDTFKLSSKVLETNTTYYWKVVAYTNGGANVESEIYSFVTKTADIVIESTASSKGYCLNDSLNLFVNYYGSADTFQWYKDGTEIAGATDSTLIINPFTEADAANYTCKLSDTQNDISVTTDNINIVKIKLPTIIYAPQNVKCKIEGSVDIGAVIDTTYLPDFYETINYQWCKDGIVLTDTNKFKGIHTTTLTIVALEKNDTNSTYRLMIATKCGDTLYTDKVGIIVSVLDNIETEINSIQISPNPVIGNFNVSIDNKTAANSELYIYDINGKVICKLWAGYLPQGNSTYSFGIDNYPLNSGMYFLAIKKNGHLSTVKFSLTK